MDMYLNHASFSSSSTSSNRCRIQDQILQVSVVSGTRLKNTEWLTTQDPYVVVQYAGTKFRTKTCLGGGTNPVFRHEKFEFELIEGLREITVVVQNSNKLAAHDLIGYGKVDLQNVLSEGFQEVNCLLTNDTRCAGEIKLILSYPNAQTPEMTYAPRQPTHPPFQPPLSQVYHHHQQQPSPTYQPQTQTTNYYPPPPPMYSNSNVYPPPPPPTYQPQTQTTYYPPPPPPMYSNSNVYPPPPDYQPPAYNSTYPPPGPSTVYPPSPGQWPSSYYTPPSPYHGCYPPY